MTGWSLVRFQRAQHSGLARSSIGAENDLYALHHEAHHAPAILTLKQLITIVMGGTARSVLFRMVARRGVQSVPKTDTRTARYGVRLLRHPPTLRSRGRVA